jgi:acyl transferase domain-containing protein/acyl carrier protein
MTVLDPSGAPDDARLRQAAIALRQMRGRVEELERRTAEPIAIVGMACRYPGGANTPEAFWDLLRDGREGLVPTPPERWDADAFYDPDPDAYWKTYTREAHYIDQPLDAFEPELFGISPREALSLDPQQRLLLEVSWEALERAGVAPDRLRESATGVYIGMIAGDYGRIPFTDINPADLPYYGTGNAISFEAGRISYTLGLQGPSMVVATACSSTLVTAHLAAQALRNGECDLAVTGGVSLMVHPDTSIILSQMRATAPDGRSKTFDAAADGFGRGEGCGVLVLKRLGDAQRDGDRVHAVIRSSAVNHDGASGGITVPSGPAQEKLVRQALKQGRLQPSDIDVIEAHGTGTPLGDPIELIALAAVLGQGRPDDRPLRVGSVKTNIGHLEAAAGVAGIMKLALALEHEELPPHRNLQDPNPHIPWDDLALEVPTVATPWRRGERPRRAGVSGFGLSGINAHVILEEAPPTPARPAPSPEDGGAAALLLSARTEPALEELAGRYADLLESPDAPPLADVCAAAATQRARLPRRRVVVAPSATEMATSLRSGVATEGTKVLRGTAAPDAARIAWMFTGQGAQFPGMGRGLYDGEPVFAAIIDHCDELLRDEADIPLRDIMFPEDPADERIHATEFTQPALFALELALARLWESWGLRPDVVLGHSIGEYAAAVVAGLLGPDDALRLVAARGRLMQAARSDGAMAAIALDEQQVRQAIAGREDTIALAAINGPRSVVISGDADVVAEVSAKLSARGAWTRDLVVSHAFHSPHMTQAAQDFAEVVANVPLRPAQLPIVNNVGGRIDDAMSAPDYWARQIREAVRFADGVAAVAQEGISTFLELGPRPVLTAMGQDTVPDGRWLTSLRPDVDDRTQVLTTLGELWVEGLVDVDGPYGDGPTAPVGLPTYPFQRRSFWLPLKGADTPDASPSHLDVGGETMPHPLLGRPVNTPGRRRIVETVLSVAAQPWLADHRVYDHIVVPATVYIELALAMGQHVGASTAPLELRDVALLRPLTIDDRGRAVVQVVAEATAEGRWSVEIHSQDPAEPSTWRLHATATVGPHQGEPPTPVPVEELRRACDTVADVSAFYDLVGERGIGYGPAFRALKDLRTTGSLVLGQVELGEGQGLRTDGYLWHPVVADACLQALGAVFPHGDADDAYVPVGAERIVWYRPSSAAHTVRAALPETPDGTPPSSADFTVYDEEGNVVADIVGLQFRRAPRSALLPEEAQEWQRWLFAPAWVELPALEPVAAAGQHWLVVGDDDLAVRVADRLTAAGAEVLRTGTADADPTDLEQVRHLVRRVLHERPVDGVVHVASCRPVDGSLRAGWRRGAGGLLHLARALATEVTVAPPRLIVLTRDTAEPCTSTDDGWQDAIQVGLAKVIGREHPELGCRLVDVATDSPVPDLDLDAVVDEFLTEAPETRVAIRSGRRLGERLHRARTSARAEANLREDGSYLIAGGLGGIGLALAEDLARRGAGRLVLAGRTPPTPEVQQRLDAISVPVEFVAADLGDVASVAALVDLAGDDERPLRGVFNLAAVIADGIVLNTGVDQLDTVLRPKVEGSWLLHEASAGCPLDHFVLFGSAAGLGGNPGQAAYAAANTFLDGLAAHRHRLGLPVLVVDWGAWQAVGATDDVELMARLERRGARVMTLGEGLAVLDHLMRTDLPRAAVLPMSGELPAEYRQLPIMADLVEAVDGPSGGGGLLAAELLVAAPRDRGSLLARHLRSLVTAVLGMPSDSPVGADVGLFDIGLDSMMALEIRNQLGAALGVALPSTLVMDHPTVSAMTQFLLADLEQLDGEETPERDEPEDPRDDTDLPGLLDEIEAMSQDEARARLSRPGPGAR